MSDKKSNQKSNLNKGERNMQKKRMIVINIFCCLLL
jgi:hypothetical protein